MCVCANNKGTDQTLSELLLFAYGISTFSQELLLVFEWREVIVTRCNICVPHFVFCMNIDDSRTLIENSGFEYMINKL